MFPNLISNINVYLKEAEQTPNSINLRTIARYIIVKMSKDKEQVTCHIQKILNEINSQVLKLEETIRQ